MAKKGKLRGSQILAVAEDRDYSSFTGTFVYENGKLIVA